MAGYEYLKNFLKEENFHYDENDWLINFKVSGIGYHAIKSDTPYLQIILICNVEGVDRIKLLELCNEMNLEKFVLKFMLRDDKVWCSYEFIPNDHTNNEEWMGIFFLLDKLSDELYSKM